MKSIFLILTVLLTGLLFFNYSEAQSLSSQKKMPKKIFLSPLQENLRKCLDPTIAVEEINSIDELYKALSKFYLLLTSETVYREVLFVQNAETKKLKYENGIIQLSKVSEDGVLKPISSEKFSEISRLAAVQHKNITIETYLNELIFQAEKKSDYQKIKEIRSKQSVLIMIWSDKQIKSLQMELIDLKKTLTCTKKEMVEICNCGI